MFPAKKRNNSVGCLLKCFVLDGSSISLIVRLDKFSDHKHIYRVQLQASGFLTTSTYRRYGVCNFITTTREEHIELIVYVPTSQFSDSVLPTLHKVGSLARKVFPAVEVILAAIMGELANRSIYFLDDKYSNPAAPVMEEKLQTLQRLLLRVRIIVEEVEGRHIANQAMIHQLSILRKEMYRGYYTLDSFRSQGNEDNREDLGVSHTFCLSKFNPAKRLFLSFGDTNVEKQVERVVNNLNNIIVDVSDFVAFLKNYPPFYRQPYSMHLLLDMCMFRRKMEFQRIMNFLTQPEPPGSGSVDALPIVGPKHVGKSTLVSHVRDHERVRDLFSQILLVGEDDLTNQNLHFKGDSHVNKHGKEEILIIIELPEDIDDATWRNLHLAYAGHITRGSKMIITSRSSKIVDFGTTQPLVLSYLNPEAFWYFFKVLTFGSSDPEEQPKLASIAMKLGMGMNQSFVAANMIGGLLRSCPSAQFWRKALKFAGLSLQTNISKFDEHPNALARKNRPVYLQRMANGDSCVIRNHYETSFDDKQVPKITFMDVLYGSVECLGRIEVLAWRSRIPPYRNHICSCEIQKQHSMEITQTDPSSTATPPDLL